MIRNAIVLEDAALFVIFSHMQRDTRSIQKPLKGVGDRTVRDQVIDIPQIPYPYPAGDA
ncbi:hypothetical protein GCM10007870_00530 [Gluconobacter kondonii]|uniref:Uncharacterized protein n=1 Tax=Gluconobacter kondonii TaxID=941463 RepID=A0ABQ5WP14_9PROT|nr:hypothetical protein GCM10007870_00530 [Gluconobacter kondonii]